MTDRRVLIVGAGPTGLVLALWLTRLGVPVRIIDKAAEPGTTSRALAVQVRTLEFYRQLGIADLVIDGGVKIAGLNFWVQGARAARIPFREIGLGLTPYPFVLVFPQDAHERLLIDQLDRLGVHVERQVELVRFDQFEHAVRAVLRRADGDEEIFEAGYLAGCDGASSTVRDRLHIGFAGGTYEGLFYVADVEATGPADNGELHVDLEEADFALVFPLKGRGRLRLVGVVRDADQASGLTFDDVRGRAVENLKLDVSNVNWFSTYKVHHRVATHFHYARTFLLGDAAHIHSPVGGQGMNTGIGDAINLAWKLAAVLHGHAPADLLNTYEPERSAFAHRLVNTTDRIFTIVTRRGTLARLTRTRVVPMVAPWIFRRAAARRFLFRTASQTAVHYRQSTLSDGVAGKVRGGDRLPWVEVEQERDNFESLASLDWQAHVYGQPRRELLDTCENLGLPLNNYPWRPEMNTAGLLRDALYLVRPDGYVALADPSADPETLRRYFAQWSMSPHVKGPSQSNLSDEA